MKTLKPPYRRGELLSVVVPVGGRPQVCLDGHSLADRLLTLVARTLPRAEIVMVGYRGEDKPAGALWAEVEEGTGTAHAVTAGLRVATRPDALLLYGDLVCNPSAIRALLWKDRTSLLVDGEDRHREDVGVNVMGGLVVSFSYGLRLRWRQVAYLKREQVGAFQEVAEPLSPRLLVHEVFAKLVDAGHSFLAVNSPLARAFDVDAHKDLAFARQLAREYPIC